MARVSNDTKTANKSSKTVKKTQKTTKKSLENENSVKKISQIETIGVQTAPKTKVKNTGEMPPKMSTKNLIAAVGKKKTKGKAKVAAVAKTKRIAKWEEPENLVKLEGWARDGLSMEQIAHNMGISKQTLYRWQDTSSYICDAIKKGKEVCDYMVENALFNSAMGGNVVAQIFWLKNRMPDRWQDKVEQKVEASVENTGGVVMLAPRLEEDNG